MRIIIINKSPGANRELFNAKFRTKPDVFLEVWNLSNLFYPKSNMFIEEIESGFVEKEIVSIRDLQSELLMLNKKDHIILNTILSYGEILKYKRILSIIFNSKAQISALQLDNKMPSQREITTLLRKIELIFRNFNNPNYYLIEIEKILFRFKHIKKFIGWVKPLKFSWVGVNLANLPKVFLNTQTSIIYLHSTDYEKFMLSKKNATLTKGNELIFLDTMGPAHPDYLLLGIKQNPKDEATYFDIVNEGLVKLEDQFQKKIIIAAHPKGLNFDYHTVYENFQVVHGYTTSLVYQSSLVILCEPSASVGLAVLCNKPVIYLNSFKFSTKLQSSIVSQSKIIGATLLEIENISNKNIFSGINRIPNKAYEQYKQKYIKRRNTPERFILEQILHDLDLHNVD